MYIYYFQKWSLSSGKCSIISSTRQSRILQSRSMVITVIFLLWRSRSSCERFILYLVYRSYWEIPFSFIVFQSLSYVINFISTYRFCFHYRWKSDYLIVFIYWHCLIIKMTIRMDMREWRSRLFYLTVLFFVFCDQFTNQIK